MTIKVLYRFQISQYSLNHWMLFFTKIHFFDDFSCNLCLNRRWIWIPTIRFKSMPKSAIFVLIFTEYFQNILFFPFSNKYCHLAKSRGHAFLYTNSFAFSIFIIWSSFEKKIHYFRFLCTFRMVFFFAAFPLLSFSCLPLASLDELKVRVSPFLGRIRHFLS